MSINGHVVKRPLNLFLPDEMERIHSAMLDILERTGVVFESDRALGILSDAGCRIDKDKKLVKIPAALVEDSLRKCPSRVTLKASNPDYNVTLGGNRFFFCPWIGMDCVDLDTWERRPPRMKDFAEATKVLDFLDEVHIYGFGPWCNIHEEEGIKGAFFHVALCGFNLTHVRKALFGAAVLGAEHWVWRMFNVAGVKPAVLISGAPPLSWPGHQIDTLLSAADNGFILNPFAGVVAGASSPATLAGSLAQNYAEVAATIVLGQVYKPGVEILAGNYSQIMDMRTGCVIQGGPERALLDAGWSQLWRHNNIPHTGLVGSDAKSLDYQCASEKTLTAMTMALAGSSKIYFHGGIYDELTNHPVAAILDNDVAKMIARLVDGINITDDTLGCDVINETGPVPGSFLNHKHTRDWWKKEQVLPDMFSRLSYPEWVGTGKKDIISRAREKYDKIIATHEFPVLSPEQEKELEEIKKAAKLDLEKKGVA